MALFWPILNPFRRPLVGAGGGGRWKVESMIVGGGGAGSTEVGSAYPHPLQWPRYIPATSLLGPDQPEKLLLIPNRCRSFLIAKKLIS